ncbi:helix-turn-helix transcriptional regulator [Brevibacillus sp. B_LB10_24]|uniref:helix-turn-helix transcriptional regulator n=1 Tax=Brevibacillus sp. B_LB10_24 TaxID=3380645 RepID=UPI0038BC46F3
MKLERLISMIYMLLNNEVLSASALAKKYNVSQRTIYRDIDAICAAGIPVVSYQGVNGGYGIMEEYKLDKSLLGSYDVESLITILHSMSTVFDDEHVLGTINRLQTIQHENRGPSLSMDIGGWRDFNESLRLIRKAITDRCVIRFEYVNAKNERANRIVEPVRLMYKHETWYLYGYCRTRSDYREFRITRMANLASTPEVFHTYHVMEQTECSYDRPAQDNLVDVVLHFSVHVLARAMDRLYAAEKRFHDDGSLTVALKLADPAESEWLWSILLSFGDNVEIVAPVEMRQVMKDKLKKILALYSEV